jgi:hypothetical protein
MATYFCIKYTLGAKGVIQPIDGKQSEGGYITRSDGYWQAIKLGRDVFLTEAEAMMAAHAAREKKLKSLRKQIKALEAMTFSTTATPAIPAPIGDTSTSDASGR